jgi:YHS domain-containing protein
MEGLIWLLVFAGMFYVMMRFGCGAHMVHGGHAHHAEAGAGRKDPVCGMPMETGKGYTKSHAGTAYWFCSRDCLDKFEAEPQKYLAPGAEEDMK